MKGLISMSGPYWGVATISKQLRGFYLTLLSLAILAALTAYTHAHEIQPTVVDVSQKETGEVVLNAELNLEAFIAGIGADHEDTDEAPEAQRYNALRALDPAALEAAFEAEKQNLANVFVVSEPGRVPGIMVTGVTVPNQPDLDLARSSIVEITTQPMVLDGEKISISAVEGFGEVILRVKGADGETVYSEFLNDGDTSEPFSFAPAEPQSWMSVFLNYIAVGFEHIVPLGLDHIIFVIGLFLFSPRLRPLLLQVTAFTLAHTITLALGATGVLALTPWIVESIIALSIVYVALENIFLRNFATHRIALVFAFGLLHGLGFAGVLGEFGLPEGSFVPALLGFNIGVEFGQLAVIAVCLLLTFAIRDKSWYRAVVTVPVSLIIALIGAYWVLERTGILPESMGGLI
jgi:hypothetical protein